MENSCLFFTLLILLLHSITLCSFATIFDSSTDKHALLSFKNRLRVMSAAVNSFTGEMPTWLGSLPQLQRLILYNNSFSGRIPPSLFNNSKMQIVNLGYNHLSGNIPEEIGNASSLQILYLDFNELSGSIPSGMFNVSSMRQIRIMFNSLTGWLPSDIVCNNIPSLETLHLPGNQLSGEIPGSIGKCRSLKLLVLSVNDTPIMPNNGLGLEKKIAGPKTTEPKVDKGKKPIEETNTEEGRPARNRKAPLRLNDYLVG